MELFQRKGFRRKRFVIKENALRIETKDTNSTEAYEVSYEEIGDRITTAKASKRIFVFTLFPTIVLMIMKLWNIQTSLNANKNFLKNSC